MVKKRCINFDWLEVYCLEDYIGFPHDADYFRRCGFHVECRDYGTPVYHQMFVVYGADDYPMLEIRRDPKSAVGRQINGVLDPMACHVRLVNRTCYFNSPVSILQQFLEQYGLHYQRISRLDIALDFEKFDYGDDPAEFMRRYMAGRYAKINQANISAHGRDQWDGRIWNSLKWGQEKSMVSTKFYNKTMEIKERTDKPYIRQAWRAAGLVDDDYHLSKVGADGNEYYPEIWRVEFSIKSGTRNWFIIEDYNGAKKKIRSIRHDLNMYKDKQQLMNLFFSLADHYFHFKKFKAATRKDRCPDKLLFNAAEQTVFYKLENVATAEVPSKSINRLIVLLREYQETHCMPDIYKACEVLIEQLEYEGRVASVSKPWPKSELFVLRQLIAKRIHSHSQPLTQDVKQLETMIKITDDLFGEK